MARTVITDAGPLIAFASIDGLSILQKLFSEITIVGSVKDECLAKLSVDAQRIEDTINNGWLVVTPVVERSPSLSPSLGVGESDSIRFALEMPEESLLIMDDRLARRYALRKNLNIVGTVRLLDLAEQQGLIESAEQSIQEMTGFGYRVSNDILKKIRSE
ncbi:MAG: DUF3368 domain-containing protein [gamma proteobacterium endosymbiont of Lamellibrachia anaximandri]|nr:DUF3368 domain-containing protein [gamma proteobacterium endosymbiont of Lamellibrachia anaximandri]